MERKKLQVQPEAFPPEFRELLSKAQIYDSSCSREARVWFLDWEEGFYLKSSASGSLEKEAQMTEYFHRKGLAAQVLTFLQQDRDWLLTRRLPGEDCLYRPYRDDPKRLCDTTAELLRRLHDLDTSDCPVDRTRDYLHRTRDNYENHRWDETLFPDNWGYPSAREAWQVVEQVSPCLKHDALLHGDYCLPNILLQDWRFSGFIDLDCAGMGDRHIDLFWGIWSLQFNLGTDRWKDRFLDAYGRDVVQMDILNAIGAFEVFG